MNIKEWEESGTKRFIEMKQGRERESQKKGMRRIKNNNNRNKARKRDRQKKEWEESRTKRFIETKQGRERESK